MARRTLVRALVCGTAATLGAFAFASSATASPDPQLPGSPLSIAQHLRFSVGDQIDATSATQTYCSTSMFHHQIPVEARWSAWAGAVGKPIYDVYSEPVSGYQILVGPGLTKPRFVFNRTDQAWPICGAGQSQGIEIEHLLNIRGTDTAGNTVWSGPFSHGSLYSIQEYGLANFVDPSQPPPSFPLVVVPNGPISPDVGMRGTWTSLASADYDQGSVLSSSRRNARLAYTVDTVDGQYVALVMSRGPAQGSAAVSVDKGRARVVDTWARSRTNRVIVWQGKMSSGHHEITVTNLGTARHSRIDLDAVLAAR